MKNTRARLDTDVKMALPVHSRRGVGMRSSDPGETGVLVASPTHLSYVRGGELAWSEPWCAVQRLEWKNEADVIEVQWADPSREDFRFPAPEADWMRPFADLARAGVTESQVATITEDAANGTLLRAAVRRTPRGTLFSEVTAFGPLDEAGQKLATDLEKRVRDMCGMETF